MASAKCVLVPESGTTGVSGVLTLTQLTEDTPTAIVGTIKGLTPGKHGLSIHTYGDLSEGNDSCGPIFNPFGAAQHGFPSDPPQQRFAGSLGNVQADAEGLAEVDIQDNALVHLLGPHSVLGRSIVVHASEDDGGRGGHANSLTTGNTGPRVAAGVIGIAAVSKTN